MYRCFFLIFCSLSSVVIAGGFDNSGRPFSIIFADASMLQINVNAIQPRIDLHVSRSMGQGPSQPELTVDSIVSDYIDAMFGLHWHINDNLNCAAQWEQPFRFQTSYPDDQLSYQYDSGNVQSQVPAPIDSEYNSQSVTLACRIGIHFKHSAGAFSSSKLSLIAGPKYQTIKGRFSSDLSRFDQGEFDNYRAQLQGSDEWAYLIGLAYEIPELAFRVSVFFHNEIEHELTGQVDAPLPDLSGTLSHSLSGRTLTPKAVNFSLQSGIAEDWLAFLVLRWGDWSSVDEILVQAGPLSQQLDLFSNDTLNYEVGLGVKINDRLNLGGKFSSLIELNAPELPDGLDGVNLRNPQGDRYSLAFGGNYAFTSKLSLGLSASYYYLQNGRFSDSAYTVDLEASHAFVFSASLKYVF